MLDRAQGGAPDRQETPALRTPHCAVVLRGRATPAGGDFGPMYTGDLARRAFAARTHGGGLA